MYWSERAGIAWQCSIPPAGSSTPIVWNESVFITTQTADQRLLLLHIGTRSGRVLWTREIGTGRIRRQAPQRGVPTFSREHNLASPSPVTNGEVVVAHFGNGDLAAYDFNGGRLWKRNLQEDYGPYTVRWGHAHSPVLYQNLVISICIQDSLADVQDTPAESYIVAHDLMTGKMRWKVERTTSAEGEDGDAYTSPLLTQVAGRPQLIVSGAGKLDGYDPRSGRQLWELSDLPAGRTVATPTISDNVLYGIRGDEGDLFALRLGATGALSRRYLLWTRPEAANTSSPVARSLLLFTVSDDGIARCFDTKTGKMKWKQRLPGSYRASPVAVAGRVLFLNTEGRCTVVSAASRFDKLFENQLGDKTTASPAVAHGHIFIRGRSTLYCIGPSFR
jgi:outer membrane protein assembly factor BamB